MDLGTSKSRGWQCWFANFSLSNCRKMRVYIVHTPFATKEMYHRIARFIYIHTYIHDIHTCIHPYKDTCMHTYIHACIHTYIHTYVRTYVHIYIHTYVRRYIHTYIQTYIHTYKHTYVAMVNFSWGTSKCGHMAVVGSCWEHLMGSMVVGQGLVHPGTLGNIGNIEVK